MVVYETIERFLGNEQNLGQQRLDFLLFDKIIIEIFTNLDTFTDQFRSPSETSDEFVKPSYDWADDRRRHFKYGFVNAQNRDLYTQLFVLQHWNSQTKNGTLTMGEIELVAELEEADKELVGNDRKLATFDEYRKLIVNFAQRGAGYISQTNKRENTGMLYDVYWAIGTFGV
jgi:hypothetical protein